MRLVNLCLIVIAIPLVQGPQPQQSEADRVVPKGGVFAKGWRGALIDANSNAQGRTISDSRFAAAGSSFLINAGPATIYWNPANSMRGSYSVQATFKETNHLKFSSHAHPYGIFIAGMNLDTPRPSLFYCAPYANGTFITRGFREGVPGGGAPKSHDSVHKADAQGSVTQHVEIRVVEGRVTCLINKAIVTTLEKNQVVGPGRLESTDGIAGIRVGHNLDVTVSGWSAK
jgi:hypothetical protein